MTLIKKNLILQINTNWNTHYNSNNLFLKNYLNNKSNFLFKICYSYLITKQKLIEKKQILNKKLLNNKQKINKQIQWFWKWKKINSFKLPFKNLQRIMFLKKMIEQSFFLKTHMFKNNNVFKNIIIWSKIYKKKKIILNKKFYLKFKKQSLFFYFNLFTFNKFFKINLNKLKKKVIKKKHLKIKILIKNTIFFKNLNCQLFFKNNWQFKCNDFNVELLNLNLMTYLHNYNLYKNTNFMNLLFFSAISKIFIFNLIIKQKLKTNFFLIFCKIFIINFFELFLKTKIFLIFFKNLILNLSFEKLLNFLNKKFNKIQFFIGKGFFLNEMFNVILYMFKYKDIVLFKHWLIINLERMNFIKHKKFFYFLKLILKQLFKYLNNYFNIKGIYLDITGKISVSGDARTRRYILTYGYLGFSNVKCKLNFTKFTVRTQTGLLGLTLALSYN